MFNELGAAIYKNPNPIVKGYGFFHNMDAVELLDHEKSVALRHYLTASKYEIKAWGLKSLHLAGKGATILGIGEAIHEVEVARPEDKTWVALEKGIEIGLGSLVFAGVTGTITTSTFGIGTLGAISLGVVANGAVKPVANTLTNAIREKTLEHKKSFEDTQEWIQHQLK